MKETNILLYTAGAYGHFISWCCDYFSGNSVDKKVPLSTSGNCHKHKQLYEFYHPPNFKNYTSSSKFHQSIQLHENSFDISDSIDIDLGKFIPVLKKNLTYLEQHYRKSIYIYPTVTSKQWIANNQYFKINLNDWVQNDNLQQIIDYLKSQGMSDSIIDKLCSTGIDRIKKSINYHNEIQPNLTMWNHQTIFEFDVWELREFSSMYYFDKIFKTIITLDVEQELISEFPKIKFIRLDNIRDQFKQTILDILQFYEIDITSQEEIDNIHSQWLEKQLYINSDIKVNQIVSSVVSNQILDWTDWGLTIIDEFCIQRMLFDQGYEIKCWGLNNFPTNTQELSKLIIKI